jgi:hypothetical protein
MFKVPEYYRLTKGKMASNKTFGNNGAFRIPYAKHNLTIQAIASDGLGWEHVSVTTPGRKRVPTWEEMCHVKQLFWDPEDVVVQYHPAKEDYVNMHKYCLHLWRQTDQPMQVPESILVGLK